MTDKPKRPVGRPVEYRLPERIDASPEEIARRTLAVKPPSEWRYEKRRPK